MQRYATWVVVFLVVAFAGYCIIIICYVAVIGLTKPPPSPLLERPTKKVIVTDDWYGFDVVVGHRYRALEGFVSDPDYGGADGAEVDAQDLLYFRDLGKAENVLTAYNIPSYRAYGSGNGPAEPPCTIVDQNPIRIVRNSASGLGYNTPEHPIHCVLDDGRDFFATKLDLLKRN